MDFRNHGWPHKDDENNNYTQDAATAGAPQAWNAIDIVAIDDDVTVTVTLMGNGDELVRDWPFGSDNEGTFEMKKGQSLSIQALSPLASRHLGGTMVTSDGGRIVVQWKDDSLFKQQPNDVSDAGCYDVIGDQLVPTKLAGTEYIVMRGQLGHGNTKSEYVYIMAVEDVDENGAPITTTVRFATDNNDVISPITLTKRGEIKHIRLNNEQVLGTGNGKNYDALYIKSTDQNGKPVPVIVMHMAGFGCEVGGAILPRIEGCTGSTDVSVTRSTSEAFYLNIMCKEDDLNYFKINVNGSDYTLPSAWFKKIGSTGWYYLNRDHVKFSSQNKGNGVTIPAVNTGSVVKVSNSNPNNGLFHLAIINGGAGSGCRYGYFSDFSPSMGSAAIMSEEFQSNYSKFCEGDIVNLFSDGGVSYSWKYVEVDDQGNTIESGKTFINEAQMSLAEPQVKPYKGWNQYRVTINRRCWITQPDTTIDVWALGYPRAKADFSIDPGKNKCSPVQVVVTNNTIEGGNLLDYTWTLSGGGLSEPQKSTQKKPYFPGYGKDTLTFENTSDAKQNYTLTLEASLGQNCPDKSQPKSIEVCPTVTAKVTADPVRGCSPLNVKFENSSEGPYTRMIVDFGDGDIINYGDIDHPQVLDKNLLKVWNHKYENSSLGDHSRIKYTWELTGRPDGVTNRDGSHYENKNDSIVEDFGNGLHAYIFTYQNNGAEKQEYKVRLKAMLKTQSNDLCPSVSDWETITVFPHFEVDYEVNPKYICDSTDVTFVNNSTDLSSETNFRWFFGDGATDNTHGKVFDHCYW